jgi:hypothetical protein
MQPGPDTIRLYSGKTRGSVRYCSRAWSKRLTLPVSDECDVLFRIRQRCIRNPTDRLTREECADSCHTGVTPNNKWAWYWAMLCRSRRQAARLRCGGLNRERVCGGSKGAIRTQRPLRFRACFGYRRPSEAARRDRTEADSFLSSVVFGLTGPAPGSARQPAPSS